MATAGPAGATSPDRPGGGGGSHRAGGDDRGGHRQHDRGADLLDQHAALTCALEKALQDQHGIGLSEFEMMDRVVDANCGRYRMAERAGDIHLSQSALSPASRGTVWSSVRPASRTAAASSSA